MRSYEVLRELQRYITNQAIEPVKRLIVNRNLSPDDALNLVANAVGQFSTQGYRSEYKRFMENMNKIFENEIFFESGYSNGITMNNYQYKPSSQVDQHFLFKLYEHVGKEEYDSPEQLRAIMQEILEDKRLLELGCGPGFGLDVFRRLGAKVTGIEIRRDYAGRIPGLDIRYGNAVELNELCKEDQYDIAYSQDFFTDVFISEDAAKKVVKALYNRTTDGGCGFHLITYEQLHPIMTEFMLWLESFQKGEDPETFQKWWDGLNVNEKEEHGWTNKCLLNPQYLARVGFKVTEYAIEDGDLVIVTERPV